MPTFRNCSYINCSPGKLFKIHFLPFLKTCNAISSPPNFPCFPGLHSFSKILTLTSCTIIMTMSFLSFGRLHPDWELRCFLLPGASISFSEFFSVFHLLNILYDIQYRGNSGLSVILNTKWSAPRSSWWPPCLFAPHRTMHFFSLSLFDRSPLILSLGFLDTVFAGPVCLFMGFPGGASGKEPACQCRRLACR